MTSPLLLRPLLPFIEATPALEAKIGADVCKSHKYLVKFAREISKNVDDLSLIDICDENLNILPELISSVANRPRRQNSDEKKHSDYTKQTISRLKRMVREAAPLLSAQVGVNGRPVAPSADAPEVIAGPPTSQAGVDDYQVDVLTDAPEVVKKLVPLLQRQSKGKVSSDKRLDSPLTKNGRLTLKVLLNVAVRHDIQTVEELLVSRWGELRTEWFAVAEPCDALNCSYALKRIRLKAGLHPDRQPKTLPMKLFPRKLREQVETYKALSPSGAAADQEVVRRIREKGIKLSSHEKSTIELHCNALATLLTRIPLTEELEIADLIRIETKTVIEDGEPVPKDYNPIIDPFRQEERDLEYPGKRPGFDSQLTWKVVRAIKAVAAYNGVLRHYEKFSKGYRPNIDMEQREQKKARKKEAFPMSWVDANLARLKPVFDEAIKSGTFKTDPVVLDICLCYVYGMMLRYTGVRQQGVRICAVGHNIYFNKDGSITFRWRKNEIKNDKDFTKTIKRGRSGTFAPLIDVLDAYHKRIHPYLLKLAADKGTDIEDQLFLRIDSEGHVSRFPADTTIGAQCFADVFKKLTLRFFDFAGVPPEMRQCFSAHHIRGITGDWLRDLGVSVEGVAVFLGNTRQTTEQAYLNKNEINCTAVHDEADERAARMKGGGDPTSAVERMIEVQLSSFTQEITALQAQHAAEIKELLEQNAALQAQVAVMSSQLTQRGKS